VAAVGVLATAALLAGAIWQPERSSRAAAQALADIEKGDLRSAADAARTAREADPLARRPRFAEASVASAAGRGGVARRILERTVLEFPGDPQTWLRLAEFELHHGEPLRALEVVRGALYLDPFSKAARRLRDQARAAALAEVARGGTAEERRKRQEILNRNGLLPGGGAVPGAAGAAGAAAGVGAPGGGPGAPGGGSLGGSGGETKVPGLNEEPIEEYG
jgi:predicted Zn-dependent protease